MTEKDRTLLFLETNASTIINKVSTSANVTGTNKGIDIDNGKYAIQLGEILESKNVT